MRVVSSRVEKTTDVDKEGRARVVVYLTFEDGSQGRTTHFVNEKDDLDRLVQSQATAAVEAFSTLETIKAVNEKQEFIRLADSVNKEDAEIQSKIDEISGKK